MTDLLSSCFIDIDYYNSLLIDYPEDQIDVSIETDKVERFNLISNYVTTFFEKYTNRLLKSRDYSYLSTDTDSYNPDVTIFDGILGNFFYFPNYPVNSITTFIVSDNIILEASDYSDTSGYFLYKPAGKLKYYGGFDYGYLQNIKIKYNAGYSDTSMEYSTLQYLTFQAVKQLIDMNPSDNLILSETLGSYKYTNKTTSTNKSLIISSDIILLLDTFKRINFA